MMSIKFVTNSASTERYLNKKAKRGYILESIVPFALFPPLYFAAYSFKKKSDNNRVYRVDSRKISKDEIQEYYQIFRDDGWTKFDANSYDSSQYIFYSDDPNKESIFSDNDSIKERDRNNAISNLIKGIFLFCCFIYLSIAFPISNGNTNTLIGFLSHNLYIIVAIITITTSLIRYWRSR